MYLLLRGEQYPLRRKLKTNEVKNDKRHDENHSFTVITLQKPQICHFELMGYFPSTNVLSKPKLHFVKILYPLFFLIETLSTNLIVSKDESF